jgi:hypothetical protein
MKFKLISLLVLVFFLKQVSWLGLIPMFHFPDEEQHFAQTFFLAEKGRLPHGAEDDVSFEIDKASEILGTKRSGSGTNKFTYHPEFRIPYSKTEIGIFEKEIEDLNTKENRKTMVKHEAARYGPVYYFLTSLAYKAFYSYNLFVRLFASRFVSVLLSLLNFLVIFKISKILFKDKLSRIVLTFMVGFQPMFSFVSSGINSDNLFNLLFSLVLFFCLKIFLLKRQKVISSNIFNVFKVLGLVLVLVLGYYTKEQIFISLPIIVFACLLSLMKRGVKDRLAKFIFLFLGLGLFLFLTRGRIAIPEYNPLGVSKLKETFFEYMFWHVKHTIAETIPWYWGVFNWLGVTLPRWVLQLQARLLILSALGFLVYLFKQIKGGKLFSTKNLKLFFLLGSAGIYYFAIIFWDYFFRQTHGFSFGIQGRYFFPTIVSHMVFMLVGLKTLVPKKFKKLFLKVLLLWWGVFSLIGLFTAASAYYKIWPISLFLAQASQYKPLLFKSFGLSINISLFLVLLFYFLYKILAFDNKLSTFKGKLLKRKLLKSDEKRAA